MRGLNHKKHSGLLRGAFCCLISPRKSLINLASIIGCTIREINYGICVIYCIYMPLDIEKLLEISHNGHRPAKNRKRRGYRLLKPRSTNLRDAQHGVSQPRDSFVRKSSRIIGEAAGLLKPLPSSPEPIYIPFPGYQTQVIRKRAKLPPRRKTPIRSKMQSA